MAVEPDAVLAAEFGVAHPAVKALLIAADEGFRSAGKKTWLGKDKGQIAFERFRSVLLVAMDAVDLRGLTAIQTPMTERCQVMREIVARYATFYPEWADGAHYCDEYLREIMFQCAASDLRDMAARIREKAAAKPSLEQ